MCNVVICPKSHLCHQLIPNLKELKIPDRHAFPQRIKTGEIIVLNTQDLGPLNSNCHWNGRLSVLISGKIGNFLTNVMHVIQLVFSLRLKTQSPQKYIYKSSMQKLFHFLNLRVNGQPWHHTGYTLSHDLRSVRSYRISLKQSNRSVLIRN
jgi:hypothetical protein